MDQKNDIWQHCASLQLRKKPMSACLISYKKKINFSEKLACIGGLGNVRLAGHIRPAKHLNVAHEQHLKFFK